MAATTIPDILTQERVQTQALKLFVGISAFVHLIVAIMPALFVPRPIVTNDVAIDVALLSDFDFDSKMSRSSASAETKEEPSVDPKLLPQLPKRFEIKEPEEKKVAAIDPEKKEPEPEAKKDPNADEAKAGVDEAKKKNEDLAQLTKKNAFERLLKEQERQKKKDEAKNKDQAKKTKAELKKLLKNREKEIAELAKTGGLSAGAQGNLDQHPYVTELKIWIKRHYNLPEIYAEQFAGKPDPIVEIVLDGDGNLGKIKLIQTSTDPILDEQAIKTIEDSAPFPKPPLEFVGKLIYVPFKH